jgi:hypothetical protein
VLLVVNDENYWKQFANDMVTNHEFDDTITSPFYTYETARLAAIMSDQTCADTSLIVVEGLLRLQQLEPKRVTLPRIGFSQKNNTGSQSASSRGSRTDSPIK